MNNQLSTTGGYYINPTRQGLFTENTGDKDRPYIDMSQVTTQLASRGIIPFTPQFNGVRRGSDNNYYQLRDGKYYKVTIDNQSSPVQEGYDTYTFFGNIPVREQSEEIAAATQTDTNDNASPANQTPYKGYFAANGLGDYQSLAARRKWIADNAEWLKGQGFSNYDPKKDNVRLAQLIKQKQSADQTAAEEAARRAQEEAAVAQQVTVTPTPKTYTAQQLLGMSEADAIAAGAKDAWAQVQADKLYYDDYNTKRSGYTPNAQYTAGLDVTRAAMQGYGQDALTRGRFRQSYNNYMQNIDNFSSDEKMRNYLRSLRPAERLRQKRIHENMGIYQQNADKYTNTLMAGKDVPTWDPNKVYTISQKNGGRINYFKYFE